jgi:hypothetical protein
MRTVTLDEWETLEDLPHGTAVFAAGQRIVMNREDPYVQRPFFDCEDGGYLATNHVFSYFDVDTVLVAD